MKGRFDKRITHGSGTPLKGSAEKDVSDKPSYLRKLPELTAAEKSAETEITRQRAESLYALDVQIRRTLAHLRRLGQLKRTVVMFTSDNGYYLGEHRKRSGKINLHEPSLRVPLVIAGPGVPRGRRYDPITTIDLAPTLASYAGTTMAGTDGTSLLPTIRGGDQGWSRAVVTEGMMGFGRYGEEYQLGREPLDTRGLRLGRWKLTRYSTGEAELYDLLTDPLELKNLNRVPRYAGTLRRCWTCTTATTTAAAQSAGSRCRPSGSSHRPSRAGSPSTRSAPPTRTTATSSVAVIDAQQRAAITELARLPGLSLCPPGGAPPSTWSPGPSWSRATPPSARCVSIAARHSRTTLSPSSPPSMASSGSSGNRWVSERGYPGRVGDDQGEGLAGREHVADPPLAHLDQAPTPAADALAAVSSAAAG